MPQNPAYFQWVTMVKGDEEKLVHPGNLENHINAGWKVKDGQAIDAQTENPAFQVFTLPELVEEIRKLEAADAESKAPAEGSETQPKPEKKSKKK